MEEPLQVVILDNVLWCCEGSWIIQLPQNTFESAYFLLWHNPPTLWCSGVFNLHINRYALAASMLKIKAEPSKFRWSLICWTYMSLYLRSEMDPGDCPHHCVALISALRKDNVDSKIHRVKSKRQTSKEGRGRWKRGKKSKGTPEVRMGRGERALKETKEKPEITASREKEHFRVLSKC